MKRPTHSPDPSTGILPFVLGNALLGTIGVFVHGAHADPLTAAWFRCAFGLLGLTLWLLFRRQGASLCLKPGNAFWIVGAGLLMVMAWCLFFIAMEQIPVGLAVVLFHLQPLWILLLARCCLKETVGRGRMASAIVALLGLVLASGVVERFGGLDDTEIHSVGYGLGIVCCLIGAFCTACATLMAKRLVELPAGVLAWWQCALGSVVLSVGPISGGWPAYGLSWLCLASLGLIHTGLAYTLIYAGMTRLTTSRIALFQFVYPVVAIVVDWLYFDQRLTSVQIAGVILIAVSIWGAERPVRR